MFKAQLQDAIKTENAHDRKLKLSNLFGEMVLSATSPSEIDEKGILIEKAFAEHCNTRAKICGRVFQIVFNSLLKGTRYHLPNDYLFLCNEKHGNRYFSMNDLEHFRKSMLDLVEQRFADGLYPEVRDEYNSVLSETANYPEISVLLDNDIFVDLIKKNYAWQSSDENKKKSLGMIAFLISEEKYLKNSEYRKQIAEAIAYLGNLYNGYEFWKELLNRLKSNHSDYKYDDYTKRYGDVYRNLVALSSVPLAVTLKKLCEAERERQYSALHRIVQNLMSYEGEYNQCSLIEME